MISLLHIFYSSKPRIGLNYTSKRSFLSSLRLPLNLLNENYYENLKINNRKFSININSNSCIYNKETVKKNELESKNEKIIINNNNNNNNNINYDNINGILNNKSNKPITLFIYVDSDIRSYLNMKNSDRKKHIFISNNILEKKSSITISWLREIIENQLISLHNQPYNLNYILPGNSTSNSRRLNNDKDVKFLIDSSIQTSTALQLYVDAVPGKFPPITDKLSYLANMNDPIDSETYTMLSFYKFDNIDNPSSLVGDLRNLWKHFRALGRIYVAKEGINAQMAIPTNIIENFKLSCESIPLLSGLYYNIDHMISKDEFEKTNPFRNLHIRVRDQIVSDGLNKHFNWNKSGYEMPPLEWHNKLNDPNIIIFDCRNSYESDVGKFDNAIPLNTKMFSESWDILKDKLNGKPKDTPILTYCTGGIRCVKINAYLEQELGYSHISRLQGGIISYNREIKSKKTLVNHVNSINLLSKFKGINFVFDERISTRVTDDILSICETCGDAADTYIHCKSQGCQIRFIQCNNCNLTYSGCCSELCQITYNDSLNSKSISSYSTATILPYKSREKKKKNQDKIENINSEDISKLEKKLSKRAEIKLNYELNPSLEHAAASGEDSQLEAFSTYCERYSSPEPHILTNLRQETITVFSHAARMISGQLQGRFLKILTTISKAKNILELGTFTGYSALCFAEGLPKDGKIYTCEIDPSAYNIANKYFDLSPHRNKIDSRLIKASELLDIVRDKNVLLDMVFIDADKKYYIEYLQNLLGDEYINKSGEVVRSNKCLLNSNSLIIVDNTLWKGLVLDEVEDLKQYAPEAKLFGRPDRMKILANCMHSFNEFVRNHQYLETVLLPLRDGLTAIRYTGVNVI